jgi:hypothetical protein
MLQGQNERMSKIREREAATLRVLRARHAEKFWLAERILDFGVQLRRPTHPALIRGRSHRTGAHQSLCQRVSQSQWKFRTQRSSTQRGESEILG